MTTLSSTISYLHGNIISILADEWGLEAYGAEDSPYLYDILNTALSNSTYQKVEFSVFTLLLEFVNELSPQSKVAYIVNLELLVVILRDVGLADLGSVLQMYKTHTRRLYEH